MTNTSEYPSPYDTFLRAECERLTRQAFTEGLERLCDSEQVRLYELWTMFPDLKEEFEALQGTVRFVKNRYAPTQEHSEADWKNLEQRISNRILAEDRLKQPSATERKTSEGKTLMLLQFVSTQVQQRLSLVSRIAAVFALGLLCGRFMLPMMSNQDLRENAPNTASNHIVQASVINTDGHREEMRRYLNDAHLLMLGVMAMNAECGVSNPHTLLSQRERCVELLARSSRVQAGLTAGERERMTHVMGEIESALAELADVQLASCNAVKIRQLQKRTDYALCEVSTVLRERAIQ